MSLPNRATQRLTSPYRGFVNAANKVPEHQRTYQAAYKAHTRIWRIVSKTHPKHHGRSHGEGEDRMGALVFGAINRGVCADYSYDHRAPEAP